MREALFTPTVWVKEDGRIDVDFGDSFQYTYDTVTDATIEDAFGADDLIDKILHVEGVNWREMTTAHKVQQLRQLADYMEAHA